MADESPPDQRILSLLLMLLGAGQGHSREEIFAAISAYRTAKPEAGLRKFERDKNDLRELGIEIEEDPDDHRYAIDRRRYELPPLVLEDDEREALLLAAEAMRTLRGIEQRDLVEQATRKLAFDRVARGSAPPAHLGVNLAPRETSPGFEKRLAAVRGAIEKRKRLTFSYAAAGAESPAKRDVDPYVLVYSAGDWQLVGYCHLRQALRTFRVDRFAALKISPRPGQPDFDKPVGFDAASYLDRSPWNFEVGGAPARVDVVLEIAPERAHVADEGFGPDARRETFAAEDGRPWTRVHFHTGNPDYVVARVLEAGGLVRVVAPSALRARVRDIARGFAASAQAASAVRRDAS